MVHRPRLKTRSPLLLTDYADLIVGSVDDEVLGPLPIDDRTLLVSQLVHVVVYLTLVVSSLVLPSLVLGRVRQPPLAIPALLWALRRTRRLALLTVPLP